MLDGYPLTPGKVLYTANAVEPQCRHLLRKERIIAHFEEIRDNDAALNSAARGKIPSQTIYGQVGPLNVNTDDLYPVLQASKAPPLTGAGS
jgi:hypothetical protein